MSAYQHRHENQSFDPPDHLVVVGKRMLFVPEELLLSTFFFINQGNQRVS